MLGECSQEKKASGDATSHAHTNQGNGCFYRGIMRRHSALADEPTACRSVPFCLEQLDQCDVRRVLVGEAVQQLGAGATEREAASSAARLKTLIAYCRDPETVSAMRAPARSIA